ncbi:hypothetical protein CspHIS471_0105570 [Cutaneotrichosporon sp. HIS471]|nr:hypothetical protein CspHIS471_0105570 [Cutaneotrichosporon sp. HIS471]
MPVAVATVPPLPPVPLKGFNKGITQGMLEPHHSLVQPYSSFPKKITGKTVWTREDFIDDESLWKRFWSLENIASLEASYDIWAAKHLSLPEIDRSIQRFVDAGLIPGHSDEQKEAIEVLEQTAQRLALHMVLDVGDIQFVGEMHNFHARTAYVDHLPPIPRRHLLRLWLSVPEVEGGWKRPYPDSAAYKRCGIQVNQVPESCPTDAE